MPVAFPKVIYEAGLLGAYTVDVKRSGLSAGKCLFEENPPVNLVEPGEQPSVVAVANTGA